MRRIVSHPPSIESPAAVVLTQFVAGFSFDFGPADSHRSCSQHLEFKVPFTGANGSLSDYIRLYQISIAPVSGSVIFDWFQFCLGLAWFIQFIQFIGESTPLTRFKSTLSGFNSRFYGFL